MNEDTTTRLIACEMLVAAMLPALAKANRHFLQEVDTGIASIESDAMQTHWGVHRDAVQRARREAQSTVAGLLELLRG